MCGSTPAGKRKRGRSAEILPCGVDKTGFRCKYSAFFPHRKQAKIKKSERVRISAHILRGDVKFFPCASAVGASPSARRGEKRGAFRENVGGGARTWRCGATNGGRRADGRLRRPCTLGADGRRGALSEGHALYIMCLAAQNRSDSRRLPTKPPPATKRSAVGALLWACVGTEGAGFSVCRRAYLFRPWVRPLRSWWWALRQPERTSHRRV